MSFGDLRRSIERAALTQPFRYEYMAALELMGLEGPGWAELSFRQQERLIVLIRGMFKRHISLRTELQRRMKLPLTEPELENEEVP